MRIVYTNLKEDDAGVKRSARQLLVEFNGTSTRSAAAALAATPIAVAPDERSDADRLQRRQTPEAAHALCGQRTAPRVEGMRAFRSVLIKKFVDTQTAVQAGKKGNVSITV
jgi:hypothetical protein